MAGEKCTADKEFTGDTPPLKCSRMSENPMAGEKCTADKEVTGETPPLKCSRTSENPMASSSSLIRALCSGEMEAPEGEPMDLSVAEEENKMAVSGGKVATEDLSHKMTGEAAAGSSEKVAKV